MEQFGEVATLIWGKDVDVALKYYFSTNTPVVIKGMQDFEPLNWTIDSMEKEYGNATIRVVVGDSPTFIYNETQERTIEQMTLSEFIDKGIRNWGAGGKYYVLGRGFSTQFDGMTERIILPDNIAQFHSGIGRFLERNLWMSHGGTCTALHFDTVDNFNIQIQGEKRFWLYPTVNKGMYPMKFNSQASYVSPVTPRNVDREKYPDFPQTGASEAVLQAGDTLYLPYSWWHQVDTTGEENLNVNVWWAPKLRKMIKYWPQTLRGLAVLAHRGFKHPHKRAEKMRKAGGK